MPARRVSRRAPTSLRPFRHRGFSLLWAGGFVSIVGSWMQTVAVGALITARTGRASWAVLVAAGAFLPIGVLSPVGGALADRIARRPALVASNLVQALLAALLAVLVAHSRSSPALLIAVVTLQGCVSALSGPFQQAILPDLVGREELLAAASLGSAQFNLGRVLGPALAGATIAAFGYPVAFVANAISFLAVVAALAFVPLPPPPGRALGGGLWRAMSSGAAAAWGEPSCRAAITTIALVALLASPFIALVPVVALHLSHGAAGAVASATGLLTTAQGLGAVVGALGLPALAARHGRGRVLIASIALLPPALVGYSAAGSLAIALVALAAVGVVYIGVLSGLSTVVQLRAPSGARGRVLSFYLVALGVAYPFGSLLEGPLADRLGVAWTTGGSAVLLAAALAGLAIAHPGALRALLRSAPGSEDSTRPDSRRAGPRANGRHTGSGSGPMERRLAMHERPAQDEIPVIEAGEPLAPVDAADIAGRDSEVDFDDETEEDQLPLDELEARELGVLLDDPEVVAAREDRED